VYVQSAMKMTLDEFRTLYTRKPWNDEDLAEAAVADLPAYIPFVQASREFLEACKAFDAALEVARIERD
jgi:hypothetical protein